jgi:TusA-related sulfurtransferase
MVWLEAGSLAALLATGGCAGVKHGETKESETASRQTVTRDPRIHRTAREGDAASSTYSMVGLERCPSAVRGAVTTLKAVPDGIEIEVVSTSPEVTREIRARAEHAEDLSDDNRKVDLGASCPVFSDGSRISSRDIDGGSRIKLEARDKDTVEIVRSLAYERQAELRERMNRTARR